MVYDDDVFVQIPLSKLLSSLVQVFGSNLPDTKFNFSIIYHYETDEDEYFDIDTGKHVLDMDDMLIKIVQSNRIPVLGYTRLDGLQQVYDDYRDSIEIDDEEEDEDEYEEEDTGDDILSYLTGIDIPKKKKKKSNEKEYYGRSRVWKNCKQPRKYIQRHGVLIASEKDDLKKDEKTIKQFLKDFLPGGAGWKKEFREDVLERWMNMYAISKKTLRQLEKRARKPRVGKRNSSHSRILKFTDQLFNVPVDRWSDPTR